MAPAGPLMLSEFDRAAGRAHVMLAVPVIGAVQSVDVDSLTAGDAIEVSELGTATTGPSPRGLYRGSTQSRASRHAETPRARPPVP